MIDAPARIKASNVEELVARMETSHKHAPSSQISVNMERVEAITRPAGAFLSNALLTQLADVPLEVVAPARSPVKKLTCSGLGFAFAHRQGSTSFRNVSPDELHLERWRLPWTPARVRPDMLPLKEPDGREDPSFWAKADAAFVNPHATARRQHRRDVPYRVQGWLHAVLPPRALGALVQGPQFLDDLQDLVYELVDNVAEHAWPAGYAEPRSLVQVSVARGNDPETRDRIWVVVMDTGPGIVTTAAPKISDPTLSSEDLLQGLLNGTFLQPAHHRARGLGLPRVFRISRRWKDSRIDILTDRFRVRVENGQLNVSAAAWKVQGTVILARFTTPPILAKETI